MSDADKPKRDALELVYDTARFLKRCNVKAFSGHDDSGAPKLSVELVGGTIEDWHKLWNALEAVGRLIEKPTKVNLPRETL